VENKSERQWSRNEIIWALYRNQFVPFFQPKIDLVTGIATCVEILARWDHPELGILPPCQFIELMEQGGLIDEFTDNLLRQSLASARQNAMNGWEIGLAINVSPLTLSNIHAPYRICSLVKEYEISFDQITIEVTETAHSENFPMMLKSLTQLRMQGFKISIDDFGTGYSSLQLLSQMPFTEIKIDRSFVAGISNDRKSSIILESIVHLADKLHMRTVAEGIETRRQFDFVRSLGCSDGQGFYLGEPMRNPDLIDYLEESVALKMA
jgi:EAL domain-containing protein (putative c-di-GMP-specific phosphodiesterase class I)